MIIAYYTETKKYLQKGEYIKHFNDVKSLSELLSKIKTSEKVLVKSTSKEILKSKITNKIDNVDYEILTEIEPITIDSILADLESLKQGKKKYIIYHPKDTKMFGEKVYLTNSDIICKKINRQSKYLSLTINQLEEAITNPSLLVLKNVFGGEQKFDKVT